MSLVNFTSREITCKIVYYGPGRSGKTTNLQYVYDRVPESRRGRMVSLATQTDRTLFFDFLPLELGFISGFATKFQLYTVPGQSYYNATRKLVLQGADGVVFVADSQARRFDDNLESLQNLQDNLLAQGVDIRHLPVVLQYNKQDLPRDLILTHEEMDDALNFRAVQSYAGGLIIDVAAPDYETRVAILRRKAEERRASFADGVLEAVAGLGIDNVRELLGALNRLVAHQAVSERPLDAEHAKALIGGTAGQGGGGPQESHPDD